MYWVERHKAIIITFLISGILILGGFSIHVKTNNYLAETFYEIEPPTKPSENLISEDETQNLPKSNRAHNEDEAFKQMMRNFKTVEAPDTESKSKQSETIENNTKTPSQNTSINNETYAVNSEETSKYKALKTQLDNSLKNKTASENANTKSTVGFSLKGRRLVNEIPTPRYLCEYGGKIIVTIEVDASGYVTKATVNSANTINDCLKSYAITHAKDAKFNTSDLKKQVGTITFIFEGKRK